MDFNKKAISFTINMICMIYVLFIVGCSSGSSGGSGSISSNIEQGVGVFMPSVSVAESPSWISTAPSTGVWNKYISGTPNQIIALAADSNTILAFDGSNFFLSNATGGQFTQVSFSGGLLTSAILVAGSSGYVMYSGNSVWSISDTGTVVSTSLPGLSTNDITSIVYLDSSFYAYTSGATVYSSSDGNTWVLNDSSQNIQPFVNVIELNSDLYCGMTAPDLSDGSIPNLWLGSSPTSFNPAESYLLNFFGAPAQVNFIGSNGNGNLFINETVSLTQQTIREYYIASVSQQSTNAVIDVISLPTSLSGQKPTGIYFAGDYIFVTSGTMATVSNPSGNLIDSTGPANLSAVSNIPAPTQTAQLVGSQAQTNGVVNTTYGTNFITAPGTNSTPNTGELTLVNGNTSNIQQPDYKILPSGESTSYVGLIGSINSYMLVFNNGGILINSGNGLTPGTVPANTINESSTPITAVMSAGSINNTFFLQGQSVGGGSNGDLYYSANGSSWSMITQDSLIAANLGTLIESGAIAVNQINNIYNITTSNGTYQTATPTSLVSWVAAPSPTPLFLVNGGVYTLYPDSTNLGTLNGISYVIMQNVLPQNYVSSGNIAYNGIIAALAQSATVVSAGDKYAGTNYVWTAPVLNSVWTRNQVSFYDINGNVLASEFFNVAPVLIWTGKVWITEGNGNVLMNPSYSVGNIYSSNDVISWNAESYDSQAITGIPVAF